KNGYHLTTASSIMFIHQSTIPSIRVDRSLSDCSWSYSSPEFIFCFSIGWEHPMSPLYAFKNRFGPAAGSEPSTVTPRMRHWLQSSFTSYESSFRVKPGGREHWHGS